MITLGTLETLWEQFSFSPNPAQKEAILHTDGPLYLPAGPGSGKTRVLLWRTVNLIACHDVDPQAIFLATFTEKAAGQLREGIRALLGAVTNINGKAYDVERMYVGTVHSLCQRILSDRRFFKDHHARHAPALLDALSQYFQVYRKSRWATLTEGLDFGADGDCHKLINVLFGKKSASRHESVSNCLSLFNRLSEECLEPAHWTGKVFDPELDATLAKLLSCYERYCAALSGHPSRTDFSLLQQEALKVVQGYEGAPLFSHVIVDEYQDTNTIQERLFFALADGTTNLCVVGDDDQALYRFRGATVENFVQFPRRVRAAWDKEPRRIPLATNYRSRREIVNFYTGFMEWCDWSETGAKGGRKTLPYAGDYFRVPDKGIHAHSGDDAPAVVATSPGKGEVVAAEIAALCRKLVDDGTVANPNQIAFLYPSLKSTQVGHMMTALEAVGLKVYAPRAGTFLEVEEAESILGLFLQVFGKPHLNFSPAQGSDFYNYHKWMDGATTKAASLMATDTSLKEFVKDRKADIARVINDMALLKAVVEKNGWDTAAPYEIKTMRRPFVQAAGLSAEAKRILSSVYFDKIVEKRIVEDQPFLLSYVLARATSLDWNVLDLFYRFCGFGYFKAMFDLAENGADEGPVCNLGLVSQYLARFMEEYASILTANLLAEDGFQHLLFSSYLYVLFRRGESEFEDANDPFPRGRIPFLTIHQSKGLEFPVVVLGNTARRDTGPQAVEKLVAPLLSRKGEPLERMSEFDSMRMFYVALSRAKNLLVLAYPKGQGIATFPAFKPLLEGNIARVSGFDTSVVPCSELDHDDTPRNYSFTADYLVYDRCPRQYMIFRKYGFVPSRSQTMMFGSLVHQTIEDLHQFLIAERTKGGAARERLGS